MFEQPVDRGDGGVGLTRTGGHLNEGTRTIIFEGCLQPLDGVNLVRSQSRRVQIRKLLEPRTERDRLGVPVLYRLRPREAEHLPRTGFRIACVGETREHAGAFVNEWQGLCIVQPLELGNGIASGLLLDCRDLLAPILRLGLDNADRLLVDEEDVVGWANIRLVLTNDNSEAGTEVDRLL